MKPFWRRAARGDVTENNAEIVHASSGGAATAIASGLALVFSGFSLYETVLRQPELAVYVPPVIHYTRENGGEVFAVPVTIANRGARDGTVLSMELTATSAGREAPKVFYSAYFVESGYFDRSRLERSPTGGLAITKQRPKVPFAPLSVAGRGNYTGTVLFFSRSPEIPYLVYEPGQFDISIQLNTRFDDGLGWLDRLFSPSVRPAKISVKISQFSKQTVDRGDTIELKNASWQ